MGFDTEQTGYQKTALSDLQGAWSELRSCVVDNLGEFSRSETVLFHIDEAMSWEMVRDLPQMKKVFLVIHNLSLHHKAPEDVLECIGYVRDMYEEVLDAIAKGEIQ